MNGIAARPIAERVRAHPFFGAATGALLDRLAASITERRFDRGDLLLREGTPAQEFLLLLEGKVALELVASDRPPRTIQTVGPGEVIGWSWLLPNGRWSLDAIARKPGVAGAIPSAALEAAFAADPAAGYEFLRRLLPVIAERLDHARLQLFDLHE